MQTFTKTFNVGEVSGGSRLELDVENANTVVVSIIGGSVAATGFACGFEASNNSTNKENGGWFFLRGNTSNGDIVISSVSGLGLAVNTPAPNAYIFNVAGFKKFRVRVTALTAGNVIVIATTSDKPSSVPPYSTVAVSGNGAINLGKAEDAAHASGDTGIATMGVRVPTNPTVQTSAVGDYGMIAIDSEGKQIISGSGAPETNFQSYTALTTTSDVALKAAAIAGVRNYITDIIADNTAAAAARLIIKDGATQILSVSIPANSTQIINLKTPIRGTAATAINATLGAAGSVVVTLAGFLAI